jgi:hypothetical protein
LLKSRRQLGYKAVQSEEGDTEETFEEIPIENFTVTSESTCASSNVNYAYNDKHEDNFIRTLSEQGSQPHLFKREHTVESRLSTGNFTKTSTPKIILTPDSDHVIRYLEVPLLLTKPCITVQYISISYLNMFPFHFRSHTTYSGEVLRHVFFKSYYIDETIHSIPVFAIIINSD